LSPKSKLDNRRSPSSVFFFTGLYIYVSAIGGMLWTLLILSTGFLAYINYNLIQWFGCYILTGILAYVIFSGLREIRFSKPVDNPDLLALFDEVKTDFNKGQEIKLWICGSCGDIFLSFVNNFYKVILLSETAIRDILAKREKGKIVLAREVLLVEKQNRYLECAIWVLVFALFPFYISYYPLAYAYLPFDLLILLFILFMIGLLPVFIGIFPPTLNKTRHIDKLLEAMYGISPLDAITEVLKDYTVANDLIARQRWEEEGGGSVRQREVLEQSLFAAITTSLVSFILIVRFMPSAFFFVTIPILFSLLPGYIAFLAVYLFSFMLPLSKEDILSHATY
jgi:hypothetical protein